MFQGGNGFGGGAGPTGPPQRITKRNKEGPVDAPPGDFQTFGAVMVTPKNFYRLMATGQTGLLFPGGVREVFHGKGEDYELFWPEKVDFVRVAARFNATIIPISAVGAADSGTILLDAEELLNLPFVGDRLRNSSETTISARFDQSNSDERFVPPVCTQLSFRIHSLLYCLHFPGSSIRFISLYSWWFLESQQGIILFLASHLIQQPLITIIEKLVQICTLLSNQS